MPIVQLQSEFAAALSIAPPEYTWSAKPSAAGNAGLMIRVTDFGRSQWVSNGTYWSPVNGVATLKRKNLQASAGAFPAIAEVAGAFDGFIIPDDLLQSPGAPTFEARAQGRRVGTLSAAQPAILSIGTSGSTEFLAKHSVSSSSGSDSVVRAFGLTSQTGTSGNYQTSGTSGFQDTGTIVGGTAVFGVISGQQIRLYAQNGSTDSSETWAFHYCELRIRLW